MKFLIFVIDDLTVSGTPAEMLAINEFNQKLRINNYWIVAGGLASPEKAWLIDNRNNANISIGGSLFNSREFYSGFWLIEVPDFETANQLACEGSKACNRKVELRPLLV